MKRGMTSFFVYGWGGNARSRVKLMDPSWQLRGSMALGHGGLWALTLLPVPGSGPVGPGPQLNSAVLIYSSQH